MKQFRACAVLGALVVAAAVAQDREPRVCRHRAGAVEVFDAAKAERAVKELAEKLRFRTPRVRRVSLSLDEPFDGGLRACARREVRTVKKGVPPRLVGKEMLWSSWGGSADVQVRTWGCSLRQIIDSGAVPGDASLARVWGVRCVPSRVTALSSTEIQIVEGE